MQQIAPAGEQYLASNQELHSVLNCNVSIQLPQFLELGLGNGLLVEEEFESKQSPHVDWGVNSLVRQVSETFPELIDQRLDLSLRVVVLVPSLQLSPNRPLIRKI